MQDILPLFLSLLLGHLLGDFVVQRSAVVEKKSARKRARRFGAHLEHGAFHYLLTLGLLSLVANQSPFSWRAQAALLSLVIAHLIIDLGKVTATHRRWLREEKTAFLLDQALHLLCLGVVALILSDDFGAGLAAIEGTLHANNRDILAVSVVYVAVVFGGGHLIAHLLKPFAEELKGQTPEATQGLQQAGQYIGWLERFLILTAIAGQFPATAGLIIAAKSIFRFPELKGDENVRPFAEYFLIGTLLSAALAISGGLLLRILLTD